MKTLSSRSIVSKIQLQIEKHKKVVVTTNSLSARTNAINCINRKLRYLKAIKETGNANNWLYIKLTDDERFSI